VGHRALPADDLGHGRFQQAGFGAQPVVSVGVILESHQTAGDGMAGRVAAGDGQQDDIAEIAFGVVVLAGRRVVRQERDQVSGGRICVLAVVPQANERHDQRHECRLQRLGRRDIVASSRPGEDHVRHARQVSPLLERIVEKGGQHLAGEFDGDLVDEVEGFAHRQLVEDCRRALADQRFEPGHPGGREDRRDHPALDVMIRRIEGDEAGPLAALGRIGDHDAAAPRVRREHLVVGVHGDDVVEAGHRPVGAVFAVAAVVDRVLAPQPLEPGPVGVAGEQVHVGDVEILQRRRIGLLPGVPGDGVVGHFVCSRGCAPKLARGRAASQTKTPGHKAGRLVITKVRPLRRRRP